MTEEKKAPFGYEQLAIIDQSLDNLVKNEDYEKVKAICVGILEQFDVESGVRAQLLLGIAMSHERILQKYLVEHSREVTALAGRLGVTQDEIAQVTQMRKLVMEHAVKEADNGSAE